VLGNFWEEDADVNIWVQKGKYTIRLQMKSVMIMVMIWWDVMPYSFVDRHLRYREKLPKILK
jgi:hypothetical protein